MAWIFAHTHPARPWRCHLQTHAPFNVRTGGWACHGWLTIKRRPAGLHPSPTPDASRSPDQNQPAAFLDRTSGLVWELVAWEHD